MFFIFCCCAALSAAGHSDDMMLIAIACQFPFRPENFPHHILNSPGIRNFLTCHEATRHDSLLLLPPLWMTTAEFPTQPDPLLLRVRFLCPLIIPHISHCRCCCPGQSFSVFEATRRKRPRLRYLCAASLFYLVDEIKLKFLSIIFVNKTYDYCVTSIAGRKRA